MNTKCDVFSGRWIFDNISYPLYRERQCSFLTGEFSCEKFGRIDVGYQNWRWQPRDCDLPRFDGTALLEKIRGKRVVFVGDSLNKNQWISLLCLIEYSLDQSTEKSVIREGNLSVFKATEYNATIEFYWSPLLVESNCDDPFNHSITDRIVKITEIEKDARHWNDADVLVFDTLLWWLPQTLTILSGSFGSSDAIYKKVEMKLRLYEMGLNTWSDWLEININRTKTQLFFMSHSPMLNGHCYNETEPLLEEERRGVTSHRKISQIAESVIEKMEKRGLKIEYLKMTHLSDYREDAHPSIYRHFYRALSREERANTMSYAHCFRWCLPGVPDIWNEILYSFIVNS